MIYSPARKLGHCNITVIQFLQLSIYCRCLLYYRCCCGYSYTHHCGTGADVQSYSPIESREKDREQWSPGKNTHSFPTDAYGTIEFQGGPHPTKAQVHILHTFYIINCYNVFTMIINIVSMNGNDLTYPCSM